MNMMFHRDELERKSGEFGMNSSDFLLKAGIEVLQTSQNRLKPKVSTCKISTFPILQM